MANVSGQGTVWNLPNFAGAPLYEVNKKLTPFLSMIGGLGGAGRVIQSDEFALNSNYTLETPAQPAITETASLTAPTATEFVRAQDVNTVQIFQRAVAISYSKLGNFDSITGINIAGEAVDVKDEKAFQIEQNLKQVALDVNKSFLEGAYQKATSASVAAKTRGILPAITTNATAASSAALSKELMDTMFSDLATSGSDFTNMVIFCNAFQKIKISEIYGYAPQDRNVGGVNIKQIETDFGNVMVVFDATIPTDTVLCANISACQPVFKMIPSKGTLFYEDLAKTGASDNGQIYGHIGLDYGHEAQHAKITGLATA